MIPSSKLGKEVEFQNNRIQRHLKTLLVAGARPNFMKIAPLIPALIARGHEVFLVHTGQHYDAVMSSAFFDDLGMPEPDAHLGVGSGTQPEQVARVVAGLEPILRRERPDWVIVVGDVNSTLGAALITARLRVELGTKLAHVEAGLRSNDPRMPEEVNRVLTDRVADLLLTPSRDADENLLHEGIPESQIRFVGNIMIDSLEAQLDRARRLNTPTAMKLSPGKYAVVTLHRPSNVDDPEMFEAILEGLRRVAEKMPVIFPMHPRTRERAAEGKLAELVKSLRVIDPIPFAEMLSLVDSAAVVLTDSGGLQEETTALGVPCITLREQTERPITVSEGTNRMVQWPPTPDRIIRLVNDVLDRPRTKKNRPEGWDGNAAERIVEALENA
jgi:UDP-N-acetylglucosamine 2-epimerase (non-hydrolysing)